MTICYGVTRLGAKQQVKRQLMDRLAKTLEEKVVNAMATYLSGVVLASIDQARETRGFPLVLATELGVRAS